MSKRKSAPADLPKQAASFDLPITIGILAGSGQLVSDRFDQYAVVGEFALDGSMRPAKGALSMAIAGATEKKLRGLIVPRENAGEAAAVSGVEVIVVSPGTNLRNEQKEAKVAKECGCRPSSPGFPSSLPSVPRPVCSGKANVHPPFEKSDWLAPLGHAALPPVPFHFRFLNHRSHGARRPRVEEWQNDVARGKKNRQPSRLRRGAVRPSRAPHWRS